MTRFQRESPIARILTPPEAQGGPFSLLGLTPDTSTPAQIEASLQRQLDRVDQHPESATPEADEVRLALHAAAAQLLDPAVRQSFVAAYRRSAGELGLATEPEEPTKARAPEPPRTYSALQDLPFADRQETGEPAAPRSRVAISPLLIGGAIIGIVSVGLVGALWLMVRQSNRPAMVTAAPASVPAATARTPVPTSPVTAAPGPAPIPSPVAAAPRAEAAAVQTLPRIRGEFTDPALLLRQLRQASVTFAGDEPGAIKQFQTAFELTGDWWCRFDGPQQRAAVDAVIEFLYRGIGRQDHWRRILAIVGAPAARLSSASPVPLHDDEIWPAAWSVGVMSRMDKERDLPSGLTAELALRLSAAIGSSAGAASGGPGALEGGTLAGLRQCVPAMFKPASAETSLSDAAKETATALARWLEAVALVSAGDEAKRERVLTDALDWVLTRAVEPETNPGVFESISTLGSQIRWTKGGPARRRLLEWFRDPAVTDSDIRVLTSAITSKSGAEAVDTTMAMAVGATSDERLQLRARYAQAWGMSEASELRESAAEWLALAQATIDDFQATDDPIVLLQRAAQLAVMNREGMRIWRGEPGVIVLGPDPAGSMAALSGKWATTGQGLPTGDVTDSQQDGSWALAYYQAGDRLADRLSTLKSLVEHNPPLGWVDAAALSEAAMFPRLSSEPFRRLTQEAVDKFRDEPTLVSAMLDLLPQAPRARHVSRLVESVTGAALPAADDPGWYPAARRALVERLLTLITVGGPHALVEDLAHTIAKAYLSSVGEDLTGAEKDAADSAVRGVELLLDRMRRDALGSPAVAAGRLNIDQILKRIDHRQVQAGGPIQKFVAGQSGVADIMAYLIASERPMQQVAVVRISDELAAERRAARHVFEQIYLNERAIMRMWILRLESSRREGTS